MELEKLISEVAMRVQERLSALEQEPSPDGKQPGAAQESGKPGLLLIAQEHGEICHPTLESSALGQYYHVDCALLNGELYDAAAYEGVIAYTLTNEALGKLANGIFDTDYTKMFGKALLLGKKIFVPEEEVELYRYRDTAPAAYYSRMEANLKLLESSGVIIVPNAELVRTILEGKASGECTAQAPQPEKIVHLAKKVITERDMIAAGQENATCVTFPPKAILTDLAKDYGKRYQIRLERLEA